MDLPALLKEFKTRESPAAVAGILDDAGAKRLLHAWSVVPVEWAAPDDTPPAGPASAALWDWLWRGVVVDVDALAEAAGLTITACVSKLAMLRGSRLIYPDGSIARWAGKLLAVEAVVHIAEYNRVAEPRRPAGP